MSTTGLEVFDRSIHTTNVWLNEIIDELGPDRNYAWHILGAVLRCMRDQLPAELAAHLASQLPLLVRGAFYEAWNPSAAARRARSAKEFLARLDDNLMGTRPTQAKQAALAVFSVLSRHIDREQITKVRNALSAQLRRLWPESLLADAASVQTGRHQTIQQRAYEIWKELGEPGGDAMAHWLQAEREVDGASSAADQDAKARKGTGGNRSKRAATPRRVSSRPNSDSLPNGL
jgi:uncharacterized protein (DUF2267 family)